MRDAKKTKWINLPEADIKALCHKAIQILASQPMLLELEAPIKVGGKLEKMFSLVVDKYWQLLVLKVSSNLKLINVFYCR